jgi:hypothetical protein
MGRSTLLRAVVATVACAGMLAGAPAVAQAPPDYTVMVVKHGKQAVQATLGTSCQPTATGGSQCNEATYPLQGTGAVRVSRGGTVTLLFRAPAGYVRWRAARIDGAGQEQLTAYGEAKVVTKTKKRWKIVLPKNLRASTKLLGFDVVYPNAYSSFEVGATVR